MIDPSMMLLVATGPSMTHGRVTLPVAGLPLGLFPILATWVSIQRWGLGISAQVLEIGLDMRDKASGACQGNP